MIKQYTIRWCELDIRESGQGVMSGNKTRPCIITSNDINNNNAGTVEVVPLTKQLKRPDLPVHVVIENDDFTQSVAMVENKVTIDKTKVRGMIRPLTDKERRETQIALLIQNGFIW